MKRRGWISKLLLVIPVIVMLTLAVDVLAGDKGDKKNKKDKKDKKSKKEKVINDRGAARGSSLDPLRRENYEKRIKSGKKEEGGKGSGRKAQARKRNVKRVQKRSTKRSGGGKK